MLNACEPLRKADGNSLCITTGGAKGFANDAIRFGIKAFAISSNRTKTIQGSFGDPESFKERRDFELQC